MQHGLGQPYRGCLFDLYDTLVGFNEQAYHAKNRRIAELCGVSCKQYVKTWKALVVDSNLGYYPRTEDRVLKMLSEMKVIGTESVIKQIADEEHRFLREGSFLFDGAVCMLRNLRAKRLKLGLVTNASPSVWEVIGSKGLRKLLHCTIVSSQVGIRKPEAGIYLQALNRLGLRAKEAIFVGDGNDRELEGAKAVGLTTILIDPQRFRAVETQQSNRRYADYTVHSLSEIPPLCTGSSR